MKYLQRITLLALVALLLPAATTVAQESKRVEVTSIYRPEVTPARKLLAPTTMHDTPTMDVDIEYDVKPETWGIKLESHNFDPVSATYWDYNRARRGYLRIGAGAPLGSDLQLRYATQNSRVGYFGIGLNHDGSYSPKQSAEGVTRLVSESYDIRNGVMLYGGAFAGRKLFEFKLGGNYDIYNRYAELGDTAFRHHFGNGGLSLRFGDDFSDLSRLNFSLEVHGDYWAHMPMAIDEQTKHVGEYNCGGAVELGRDFGKNAIRLAAHYDMWGGNVSLDYSNVRFGADLGYARKIGIVDLELGLGYLYDKVRGREFASHIFTPKAKVVIDIRKAALTPYISFDTEVSQNGVAALYAINPYMDFRHMEQTLSTMPNTRSYNLTAGFMGVVGASRFAYRAYVGGSFMRDALFWYIPTPGIFGVEAAANNRLVAGAELECRPVGNLLIGVGFHYRSDKHDVAYVASDPRFMVDAIIEYKLNRWKIYVESDVIGRREWRDLSSVDGRFVAPVNVDLRAGTSLIITEGLEIYADGYNLLNRKGLSAIYDYAYYYRNGIGFMAGLKMTF